MLILKQIILLIRLKLLITILKIQKKYWQLKIIYQKVKLKYTSWKTGSTYDNP